MLRKQFLLLLSLLAAADGQLTPPPPEPGIYQIGSGITVPKLKHKEEPQYTKAALDARVQGECLLRLVIDEAGMPTQPAVISPLGFGLDEKALEAVSKWRFDPGLKDGAPVKTQATIKISFRLLGQKYDEKAEHRRTVFNQFVAQSKQHSDDKATPQEIETIRSLVKQKFAPAYFVLGTWELSGRNVEKNEADGLDLLKTAVDRNYGPALNYWGRLQLEGQFVPKDETAGMQHIREAAVLGSSDAQILLGRKYLTGDGVDLDVSRARHYFRLCAAAAVPVCQYRLGNLLVTSPDRDESTFLEGVAWIQLASDHGLAEAKTMADSEIASLSEDQKKRVLRLKQQLEQKPV